MKEQLTIDGSTRQQKMYDYSIEVLKIAEPPEGYYLATSFGKDSIAVQRLCDEAGVKYYPHNNITGIDPPELVYFGRKYYPDVKREWYKKSMWQLILDQRTLPTRWRRFCCNYLKEDKSAGWRCVMGIRACESTRRRDTWGTLSNRDLKKHEREKYDLRLFDPDDISKAVQSCPTKGVLTVSPMYFWTDADLWDFIRDRKMPYCGLYDEGFKRLGCVGCPMASETQRRQQFARWPGFKKLYLRVLQQLIDSGKGMLDYTAEEWFEAWLTIDRVFYQKKGQYELDI